MILPSQRDKFSFPRDVCYLNSAYMTPLSNQQQIIGAQAVDQSGKPWELGVSDFFSGSEEVRKLSAEILHVQADDIAIIPSASYGMAAAAKNLPFSAGVSNGAKILVMDGQFPANVYEWMTLAEEKGGALHTVVKSDLENWTDVILAALETVSGIEIVALANVHWASGERLDLERISAACKKRGAALVLDITQSVGAMPIDLAAIDPDFAVMAAYKWMLGPYSLGVMYVAPRWQEGKALEQGWISRADSEDFAGLVNYKDTYQPGARRFDMGERANFILSPIFAEGLRQLLEWGIENIAETLAHTNNQLSAIAEEQGFKSVPAEMRGPHILGVHVGAKGPEILAALQKNNVFASVRGESLRLAPHLWVDDQDIETFAKALAAI